MNDRKVECTPEIGLFITEYDFGRKYYKTSVCDVLIFLKNFVIL